MLDCFKMVFGIKNKVESRKETHCTFGRLRNKIAHGNDDLDATIVEERYPLLYGYVTKAIIKQVNSG